MQNATASRAADQKAWAVLRSTTAYGHAYNVNRAAQATNVVRRRTVDSVRAATGTSHAAYQGYTDTASARSNASITLASSRTSDSESTTRLNRHAQNVRNSTVAITRSTWKTSS